MDTKCHNLPTGDVSCYLNGDNPVEEPGSCEPSPDVPDFANELPFEYIIDACFFDDSTTATGCGDGEVCMPPGGGDYHGALCVMKTGDQVICPPQWDEAPPIRIYKQDDVFDGRSCMPCECVPAVHDIECPGGAYEFWDLDDCNDCDLFCTDETTVSTSECKDLSTWADSNTLSSRLKHRPFPENGYCNPGGGEPTGYVEASKGLTLCCRTF